MRHYLFSSVLFWVGLVFTLVGFAFLGLAAVVAAEGRAETEMVGIVACALFGVGFFLAGAAMIGLQMRSAAHRASVVLNGQRVAGSVDDIRDGRTTVTVNGRKTRYQLVEYSWTGFDGQRHTGHSPEAPPAKLDPFRAKDEIPVYVDPADPAKAEIDVHGLREPGR